MPAKTQWIVCPLQEPSKGLLEVEQYGLPREMLLDSPSVLEEWVDLESLLVNMPNKPVTTMPYAFDQAPNRTVLLNETESRQLTDDISPSTLNLGGEVEDCNVQLLPLSIGDEEWRLLESLEDTNACGSLEMVGTYSSNNNNNNTLDLNATSLDLGETFGYGTTTCSACRSGVTGHQADCDDGLCGEDFLEKLLSESVLPSELMDLVDMIETKADTGSSLEITERASSCESTEPLDDCPLSMRKRGRKRRREDSEEESVNSSKAKKYQEMRIKNNEASKRSRKQRKAKEVDLEHTAQELEMKNEKLRKRVLHLENFTKTLKSKLMQVMVNK